MIEKLRHRNDGSAVLIGSVIALLVAIVIGVLVWYKLNSSIFASFKMPYAGTSYAAQNATYAAINTSANTIWTLFPIVGVVVIAGIILMIVTNFGKGQGV